MVACSEVDVSLSKGHFRMFGHMSTVSADLAAVPCSSVLECGRAVDTLWSIASTRCPVFKVLTFKIHLKSS